MKNIYTVFICFIAISGLCLEADQVKIEPKLDVAKISTITGLRGKFNESEGVYKLSAPRNDVAIIIKTSSYPSAKGFLA